MSISTRMTRRPTRSLPDELGVMLANGVTTIRLMIGTPEHLALRREIEAGRMVGPQLWVASPQFTGRKDTNCRVVKTAAEAEAAVKEVADAGYDFIKLTVDITPEVFDAIVAAAREKKIPIVGHIDKLESLVAAGLTPRQALEAATTTPSAFVGAAREWGQIEPGMRADLVLLQANPLEDIRNTTKIDAVCVGGRWLDRGELDRLLQRAGERVGRPAP